MSNNTGGPLHPSQTMSRGEYVTAYKARAKQTMVDNPMLPIGVLGTIFCFIMAGVKMRQGEALKFNYWLRGRVIMQGVTIGAIIWTLRLDQKAYLEKAKKREEEREAFETRLRMAEEAHRSEMELSNSGKAERKRGWW